jgi:hypothetical protein
VFQYPFKKYNEIFLNAKLIARIINRCFLCSTRFG